MEARVERRARRSRSCCCSSTARRSCKLIPVAALSAMMLVIAVGLIDRWAGRPSTACAAGRYDSELIVNISLVDPRSRESRSSFGLVAAGDHRPHPVDGTVPCGDEPLAHPLGANCGNARLAPRLPARAGEPAARRRPSRQAASSSTARSSSAPPTVLGFEALRAAQGAQILIIDLRRVTMIDASGALMLAKLSRLLAEQGRHHASWRTSPRRASWAAR
jgi:hypothetical protein